MSLLLLSRRKIGKGCRELDTKQRGRVVGSQGEQAVFEPVAGGTRLCLSPALGAAGQTAFRAVPACPVTCKSCRTLICAVPASLGEDMAGDVLALAEVPCVVVSPSAVRGSRRSLPLAARGDLVRVFAGTGWGTPSPARSRAGWTWVPPAVHGASTAPRGRVAEPSSVSG